MKIWSIKPDINCYMVYGWALFSQIIMSIIAFYSLRINSMEAKVGLIGISLFLLRPLYRGFETIFQRKINYSDTSILYLRMGLFLFKIRKDRGYLSLENAPVMIYGPTASNTGYDVVLVRNNASFFKRLLKNKIALIHKKNLEEAETAMFELKQLFEIKDMYDVRRIIYENKQK